MCTHVVAAYTRLTDEYPTVFTDTEKTGEGVTLAEGRRNVQGCISLVFLLVRGLCLGETHHRLTLRTDETGGLVGEVETGGLALDDDTVRVLQFPFL